MREEEWIEVPEGMERDSALFDRRKEGKRGGRKERVRTDGRTD